MGKRLEQGVPMSKRAEPSPGQPEGGESGRPTIADVARLARVSVTTTARVLSSRGYSSASARQRVLSAAEQIGYVPNYVARSLRYGRTNTIGLLVADVENSFYSALAKNVEAVATKAGYFVVLCNSDDDPEKERELLNVLAALRIAGLIVTPTGANRRELQQLLKQGIKIVQMDRLVEHLDADVVLVDNESGSYEAVGALIQAGHRRIGLLAGAPNVTTGAERTRGYRRALEANGLRVDPALIRGGSFRRERAIEEVRALLAVRPLVTGIFAANNILAEACMLAITEAGLAIPADLSLVAFDDVEWMQMAGNRIASVRQPVGEMAHRATEILLERIKGNPTTPATVIYRPTFVRRASIAPPRQPGGKGASRVPKSRTTHPAPTPATVRHL